MAKISTKKPIFFVAISIGLFFLGLSTSYQSADQPRVSPLNQAFIGVMAEKSVYPHFGYIPPPIDISYIDYVVPPKPEVLVLPGAWDWRTMGKVTPVKDQSSCGTCWIFGTIGAFEARILVEEGRVFDFSEQNIACCTDPCWVYLHADRCSAGGWSWLAFDTLSKKGAVLETCDPYNVSTINTEPCQEECRPVKMGIDYYIITDDGANINEIKEAIYTSGPVTAAYYHTSSSAYWYPGYIYYYPSCSNSPNHLITIVGWDDCIPWPDGTGSGAWIVKNSWGTSWGNNGYFYLCYGSANIKEVASYRQEEYRLEHILYWDEAGWVSNAGYGDSDAWMSGYFTADVAAQITHVDFFAVSPGASYKIEIRDGYFGTLLTSQMGYCDRPGYHSINLYNPISVANGEDFTVAVKLTTAGYNYPIPVERVYSGFCEPPIQAGKTFIKNSDGDSWADTASYGWNACIRVRLGRAALSTKLGVFKDGLWYLDYNNNGLWDDIPGGDKLFTFGSFGYTPISGDWNKDMRTEMGTFVDGKNWFLDYNGNGVWDGVAVDKSYVFGASGAGFIPVAGDWNGDGKAKIGVFVNGNWYLDYNGNGVWDGTPTDKYYHFGASGYLPVTGDWNGDGKTKIGVVYGSKNWFLDYNGNGTWDGTPTDTSYSFGASGYTPVTGDWNRDGKAEIGVFINGNWFLDYNGNGVWNGTPTDVAANFGSSGYLPVVGRW